MSKHITTEELQYRFDLYNQGLSCVKIGALCHVTKEAIVKNLRYWNIQKRAKKDYIALRKRQLNEQFFENIGTEAQAYFLGFLFADGSIGQKHYSVELKLHERDVNIVEKFKTTLESDAPIAQVQQNQVRFIVCSKKMVNDLAQYGCIPRKSLILEFPYQLPKVMISHFIRGYNDGDGCICNTQKRLKIQICGTLKFLNGILALSGIIGHIYKKPNQIIHFLHFYDSYAERFCEWIYTGASIFLPRKYNKYKEFINSKYGIRSNKQHEPY